MCHINIPAGEIKTESNLHFSRVVVLKTSSSYIRLAAAAAVIIYFFVHERIHTYICIGIIIYPPRYTTRARVYFYADTGRDIYIYICIIRLNNNIIDGKEKKTKSISPDTRHKQRPWRYLSSFGVYNPSRAQLSSSVYNTHTHTYVRVCRRVPTNGKRLFRRRETFRSARVHYHPYSPRVYLRNVAIRKTRPRRFKRFKIVVVAKT